MYRYETLLDIINKINKDTIEYLGVNGQELILAIEHNVNEAHKILQYFLTDPSQIINKTSELLRPLQEVIELSITEIDYKCILKDELILLEFISSLIYEFTNIYRIRKIITLFNNDIKFLEQVLNATEILINKKASWQIIYTLSLWLSLLIMVPIKLSNIDTDGTISDKIIKISLSRLNQSDKTRESFSFLLSNFITRDLTYLNVFSNVQYNNDFIKIGVLSTLKKILKMVVPEESDLLFINSILKSIDYSNNTLAHKLYLSSKCRLILVVLDTTLDLNLIDYIDELLNGLETKFNTIRWVSAKSLGRLSNRLGNDFSNEIIDYILNLNSTHGKCLGIGEIIRTANMQTLSTDTIDRIIQVGISALCIKPGLIVNVDNVIDSACFLFWSIGISLNPTLLTFEHKLLIVESLVNNSLFDISINSRRCASASLQEFLGRQSNYTDPIPNSLDLATMLDYYSISNQINNYTQLAIEIANLNEDGKNYYSKSIIDHLLTEKLYHNDLNTRILTCVCISKIKHLFEMNYIYNNVKKSLPNLYDRKIPFNSKHGVLLLINAVLSTDIDEDLLNEIIQIPVNCENLLLFKLGDLIREEVCKLITNILRLFYNKLDNLTVKIGRIKQKTLPIIEVYRNIVMDSLKSFSLSVQISASNSLKILMDDIIFNTLCGNIKSDKLSFNILRGSAIALGHLPIKYLDKNIISVLSLLAESIINNMNNTQMKDALFRQYTLVTIANVYENIESSQLNNCINKITELLEVTSKDFDKDDRGDVGSWVRVTSIEVIAVVLYKLNNQSDTVVNNAIYINKRLAYSLISCCLEKSERVRSRAVWILHCILNNKRINAAEIQDRVYYNKNYEKYPTAVDELVLVVDESLKQKLTITLKYLNEVVKASETEIENEYYIKTCKELLNVGLRLDYYSNLEIAFKSVSHLLTDEEVIDKSLYNLLSLIASTKYQKTLSTLITSDVGNIITSKIISHGIDKYPLESLVTLEFLVINDRTNIGHTAVIDRLSTIKGEYKLLKAKISFLITIINFAHEKTIRVSSVEAVLKYLRHKYPTIREYTADNLILLDCIDMKTRDILKDTRFKYINISDPEELLKVNQVIEAIKKDIIDNIES